MTVDEALQSTAQLLSAAGIEESGREAEYLVAAALEVPKVRLVFHRQQTMPAAGERSLHRWRNERAQRKPLAYVLGEQPFENLMLSITPAVLVPRPETELLVERALKILDAMSFSLPREKRKSPPQQASVADIGTGSGNIAICLARHPRVNKVFGIDISEEALLIARRNAARHGVALRCEWRRSDLLASLPEAAQLDLLTANLPYVRRDEIDGLAAELHWEPRQALDGGENGLELISRLIEQAGRSLKTGCFLLLEIGAAQGNEVQDMLAGGPWTSVRLLEDLAKLPRIVEAQKG